MKPFSFWLLTALVPSLVFSNGCSEQNPQADGEGSTSPSTNDAASIDDGAPIDRERALAIGMSALAESADNIPIQGEDQYEVSQTRDGQWHVIFFGESTALGGHVTVVISGDGKVLSVVGGR